MQDRLVGKVQRQRAQLGDYWNSLSVEGLDKVRGNGNERGMNPRDVLT